VTDVKDVARKRVESARDALVSLSERIHAHPELGLEEEKASTWIAEALADAGFRVETGTCGMPTAFVATAGRGPTTIGICAEYDALPGIGHACGHNVIAATAVGAARALREVADDVGLTVRVLGTPAEETLGGKIRMLDGGAFDGVDVAMMTHPAPHEVLLPKVIAAQTLEIRYTGREAHAAGFPELGINAADALVVAQTAIGLLRQHLRATDRVHGIVTKGGDAPNVIPAHTAATYMVRATTIEELADVEPKVRRCFEAGAIATGATLEIVARVSPYAEMRHDAAVAEIYRKNAEALGRRFAVGAEAERAAGSTDMGNVSRSVPAIHPMVAIDSLPAVNHQPAFTAACVTPAAEKALLEGAIALAWTAIDVGREKSTVTRG
jgi:amidohydrolase